MKLKLLPLYSIHVTYRRIQMAEKQKSLIKTSMIGGLLNMAAAAACSEKPGALFTSRSSFHARGKKIESVVTAPLFARDDKTNCLNEMVMKRERGSREGPQLKSNRIWHPLSTAFSC